MGGGAGVVVLQTSMRHNARWLLRPRPYVFKGENMLSTIAATIESELNMQANSSDERSEWPPCIITMFDLVGTSGNAPNGAAAQLMLKMRKFAVDKINAELPSHRHGYVWNDSILLLSYITSPGQSRRSVLMELSGFKQTLEQHCGVQSYAISVQGLAFPQDSPVDMVSHGNESRVVVLKTSSYAMANCFAIEKALKGMRADWYIDSRITKDIQLPAPFKSKGVRLLPENKLRIINMYKGYLHATS